MSSIKTWLGLEPGIFVYLVSKGINPVEYVFKAEHEITDTEFAEDHWQTLFVLTYPEARP